MKTTTKLAFSLWLSALLGSVLHCHATGTFIPGSQPPDYISHTILMPDGTVLASQLYIDGSAWYRLTPDIHGSYANGTWSSIATPSYSRLYFASAVLKDGRLFVAGGEDGNGNGATAEIYNPTNNTWTLVSPPSSLIDPTQTSPSTGEPQRIADAECKVLPDGRVLVIPADPKVANGTLIFDPTSSTWTAGPPSLNFLGEASAVKIPDGSVLTLDADDYSSERYLPALNVWTNDASTSPAFLWQLLGPDLIGETGPGFLLPNGNAIFFGGTGQTAIYTPSGNNTQGTWVQGPSIPGGNVMSDAPGAMMNNGKILIAASTAPTVQDNTNVVYPNSTSFYEYDYAAPTNSAFTQVSGLTATVPTFVDEFLNLPDGNVYYSISESLSTFVYKPDGSPLAAGKPTILSITTNSDGSLHFTGALFNGISEGASYGDDHQMDTAFPLVRFIDASGNVRYGRTYNWSSTEVMTGSSIVTTECSAPAGSSSQDLIQVVANGSASGSVNLNLNPIVTTLNDSGAGSLRQVVSNALSGATITFAPGLSGQTIALTSGDVPLNRSVTIDASALPAGIKINGNHNSRIFDVAGGATVILYSLTITNGFTSGASGGGVQNAGTLTLNNCTLAGNSTDNSDVGGAINNFGTLTLTGCTLVGNSSDFAGAIQNDASCSLVNCTLANNTATGGNGGAIDNDGGTLDVTQCTFSGNSAAASVGGGIDNYQGQVTLVNSILANNNSDDFYNWPGSSVVIFAGNNIVSVPVLAGIPIIEGAIFTADPMLGPLANNGGPTLTMMPQTGSLAIDLGLTSGASGITYDQRGPGFPRVVGPAVDIGAVEVPVAPNVFTAADSGYGSLRFVATYAPSNSTITFAPALAGQTITLTSGDIPLNQNLTIDDSSLSSPVQVNGNHNSRIFDVAGGATVVLNSLIITNGFTSGGSGGGVQNAGTLSLNNCTLAGNSTDNSDVGGAINNFGTLTLTGCTLSGNSADFAGAIQNDTSCSLVNCTFANNTAPGGNGGAIDNVDGTLGVTQCTFSGNSCVGVGGGIDNYQGQVTLVNTILVNNGEDFYNWPSFSVVTFAGNNIVLVPVLAGGIPIIEGEIITADPMLRPLANNGGPTLTMMPRAGSLAIDMGITAGAAGITYDQRGPGFPRVVGAAVDIGAVEVQTILAGTPPMLTGTALTNNTFGFSFTNVSGASFSIYATTNIALPLSNWSNLGPAVESPLGSGQYQFTDPQAGSSAQRFYLVRSP